jgi:hypothetical protein
MTHVPTRHRLRTVGRRFYATNASMNVWSYATPDAILGDRTMDWPENIQIEAECFLYSSWLALHRCNAGSPTCR